MKTFNKIIRRLFVICRRSWCTLTRFKYLLIGQIRISSSAVIEPHAKLIVDDGKNTRAYVLDIGDQTSIRDYARLCPRSGFIKIGKGCSINPYCVLLGYGGITIGNHVRIASHTTITAFNHVFDDPDETIHSQGNTATGITIENDVWIGAGVRVLDGVTIGRGAVIGAGSVVTKSIPPCTVAVGVPARVIKNRAPREKA